VKQFLLNLEKQGLVELEPCLEEVIPREQDEFLFHPIAAVLMHGVDTSAGFLQMVKANARKDSGDKARFKTDYEILLNQELCGYLDIEWKARWGDGEHWPWPKINVPIHPMRQWKSGNFTSRETNKIRSFRERPFTSFWVACSKHYGQAMIVPAKEILDSSRGLQGNRYSKIQLPVFHVEPESGMMATNQEEFANHIVRHIENHICR
tara:strand:+ start:118 stop:738 length:621 start_codon:yes stop_codon:yes gene_type:complete